MPEANPITQQQAADLLGVTLRHFQRIIKEPGAPPKLVNASGRASGFRCNEFGAWMRHRFAADMGVGEDGKVYDEKLERARLLHHQANNEALKEAINRGELIPAELVISLGAALVSAARAKMLAVPSKVRGRFPGLDKGVCDEVDQLTREALTELGSDGLHADIRRRIAPAIRRMDAAAGHAPEHMG
jgi:phage terminase Nu1 subunit (DNA packaging protein)